MIRIGAIHEVSCTKPVGRRNRLSDQSAEGWPNHARIWCAKNAVALQQVPMLGGHPIDRHAQDARVTLFG
jgi:hypothetical protein